ncbi:hypothetical protein Pla175_29730 [Pirellulimonas nuda]|uniref:Uncharacterized protein n=1 Tax=Pirellulimonas nuda TaxID=2528009 RepID=A0A518DDM1_9BACT|nr:hypothetical protein Pla175_29730 [Pirellulimonas nuda]
MGVAVHHQSHNTYVIVVDKQGDVRGVFDAVGDDLQVKRLKKRLVELVDEPYGA